MSGNLPPSLTTQANGSLVLTDQYFNGLVQGGGSVLATLRGYPGVAGSLVWMTGAAAANDGGQGMFVWIASSTQADDGGATCIAPYGVLTGRWIRQSSSTQPANSLLSLGLLNFYNSGVSPTNEFLALSAGVINATGGNQSAAALITYQMTAVTGGSGGVRLPSLQPNGAVLVAGTCFAVMNKTAVAINVYPPSLGQIDSLGTNTGASLPTGGDGFFIFFGGTQWYLKL